MRDPFGRNDSRKAEDWFRQYRNLPPALSHENLFRSTRQSAHLFDEWFRQKPELQDILDRAKPYSGLKETLQTLFTILYSPIPQRNAPHEVDPNVFPLQKPAVEGLLKSPLFPELKTLCENKELPSLSAVASMAKDLDSIRNDPKISAVTEQIRLIEVLKKQIEQFSLQLGQTSDPDKRLRLINRICRKQSQIDNLRKKAEDDAIKNAVLLSGQIENALQNAKEAAAQTDAVLRAFGDGAGEERATPVNEAALDKVRRNEALKQIAVLLGKYREILADKRKNSFSYGLGEKYDITTGNNVGLCLSSDLALLGTPETEVLFTQKYLQNRLLQYRKREPQKKGDGDMIVMIDESGSTVNIASWVKAFALALLDIAVHDNKKFALIHFANAEHIRIDRFEKGKFTLNDVLDSAEHFFGGGTDFEAPMKEAVKLIQSGFEKADLLMVTDGQCRISDDFSEQFKAIKAANRVTMTGILLDEDDSCGESLEPFCDRIYRVGNMSADEIAIDVISHRA